MNLSSGFYGAHSRQEFIRLADVESIIDRAARLIANVANRFEYVESEYPDWHWEDWLYRDRERGVRCPHCDAQIADAMFFDYCPRCYSPLIGQCDWCGDAVKLSDCVVVGGEVYCRFCLE